MDEHIKEKKILFFSEYWKVGGVETFILSSINALQLVSHNKFIFTIYSMCKYTGAYDKRISELSGSMVSYQSSKNNEKPNVFERYILGPWNWHKILKKENFDVIHINIMNGILLVYAAIAKAHHVPVVVVHSHNSDFDPPFRFLKSVFHKIAIKLWGNASTINLAVSKESGEHLFGNSQFTILNNAIDTEKYRFDKHKRDVLRKELGIEKDTFVFGAIGRIAEVKNPKFQIDILSELSKKNIDVKLLLIGNGDSLADAKDYAKKLGVDNSVIFTGAIISPADYYSVFDVFTMPSHHEGAPIALIEALTNGVTCVCSSNIPTYNVDAKIKLNYINSFGLNEWVDEIIRLKGTSLDYKERGKAVERMQNYGYDLKTLGTTLEKIYGW